MTSTPIIPFFQRLTQFKRSHSGRPLNVWGQCYRQLPRAVRHDPVAMRYLTLLSPLAWDQLPPRCPRPHDQQPAISYAAFAAACLIKLDQQLVSMSKLRDYLVDHPQLGWLLGFDPRCQMPPACLPPIVGRCLPLMCGRCLPPMCGRC